MHHEQRAAGASVPAALHHFPLSHVTHTAADTGLETGVPPVVPAPPAASPATHVPAKRPATLESLQVLRGFASLYVVFAHVSSFIDGARLSAGLPATGFPDWFGRGTSGVDVFFVLSGFII